MLARRFLGFLLVLASGCGSAICGDGILDANEACDDGNNLDADGCEADCSLPACDNGIADPGELCFAAPVSFAVGDGPQDLLLEDLDEDGILDIVTANSVGRSLSVLRGVEENTFSPAVEVPLNNLEGWVSLLSRDFNEDGVLDLAVANETADVVQLALGQGDASFILGEQIPTNAGPTELVSEDFDEDGFFDLALSAGVGNSVQVFFGNGLGQFPQSSSLAPGQVPDSLVAEDFDQDGSKDLAVTLRGEARLQPLLGQGNGLFTAVQSSSTGQTPSTIAAGDFDQDGRPDLVVALGDDDELRIFLSRNDVFLSEAHFLLETTINDIEVGDLDADGLPDFALVGQTASGPQLTVFLQGQGENFLQFLAQEVVLDAASASALKLADLNQDGVLDIVIAADEAQGSAVQVFLSAP